MAGFVCPQCGSSRITDGKCEYCGFIIERKKPETPDIPKAAQSTPQQGTEPAAGSRNLIKCPDCGRMISRYASRCPQCGCPSPHTGHSSSEQYAIVRKHLRRIGIVLLVIAAVVIGVSIWYNTSRHSMPSWLWNLVFDVRIFFGLRPF